MADQTSTPTSRFLEDVAEQISYKPLRPSITKELEDHIRDRADGYRADGMSPEVAEKKAVAAMGDPFSIGTELNAVRHTRFCLPLIALTAVLMLLGFLAASYMQWSPEQSANGFLYYIPGIALLILVTFKGYPWLIRYQTALFRLVVSLYGLEFLWELLRLWKPELSNPILFGRFIPLHMMWYYTILLLAPVLVIAAYRARRKPMAAILILPLSAAFLLLLGNITNRYIAYAVIFVFLTAVAATTFYMIWKGIFRGPGRKLLIIAGAGCLLSFGLFAAAPSQGYFIQAFATPEVITRDRWDDAYNGVLIKELLSRTPVLEGLSLTPEELVSYRTAQWYYESPEYEDLRAKSRYYKTEQADEWAKRWEARLRYILQYTNESNITLWDILPQHYHNNYLITAVILLYGWLPAMCLLSLPVLFYLLLFACIRSIHGKLAGSTAFCCGVLLLMQGVLYLFGNFGYQYEQFTNLPLVSEGRISIMVNMLLLGFIFSAYRYDQVIDEAAADIAPRRNSS